jgi:hypothetical protein
VIQFTGGRPKRGENSRWSGGHPTKPDQGLSEMNDTAFSALVRAWATTVIATSFFVAALALASAWDSSIYVQGLQDALQLDM